MKETNVLFVSEESKNMMKKLNFPLGIRILFDDNAIKELKVQEKNANKTYQEKEKKIKMKFGDCPF